MSKRLNFAKWSAMRPPIYWLRIDDFSEKEDTLQEITYKWLDQNVETWWYYSSPIFCFGSEEDRATFKLFLMSDFFDGEYGELLEEKE